MVENITKWKLKIIGLYRSDYLASFHVRQMAKLLEVSHVTLLPHLKSLEKDRILGAKIIGKNKAYALNLSNISSKDSIILSEKSEALEFLEKIFIIKKLYAESAKLNLPGCIVLFGSYVKRYFTKESDIDIFYLGDITEKETSLMKSFGELYTKRISLKKFTLKNFEDGLRKRDPLIKEVIESHIILQNPDVFVNALWRYFNEIKS